MAAKKILKTGRNCWRIKHADRIAFVVDGDRYFRALYEVLPQSKHSIMVLSWDIYSDLRLGALQGDKRSLTRLLDDTLKENDTLDTYILNWDFSVLFSMSREWLPSYKLGWLTHPRMHFHLDNQHPIGASHHQKVVVIDNQLAFSGGLDLTRGRWDTNEHKAHDTRRKKVDGTLGRPYHDVQIAISGEAASALNDLSRERWRRATDQCLPKPEPDEGKLWPAGLAADLTNVDIAISRTEPAYEEYQGVQEVEQLYLDSIAAAQNYIYIENQYFTCPRISAALAERLQEKEGPEIILNLPLETEGWLAQNSMDIIRVRLLRELREADTYQRLGVYYPYKQEAQTAPINLHAKVMIIDDRFVRVGSSNLNNRSMGLDTECDIAIELQNEDDDNRQGIIHFRDRLLSEHLGVKRVKVNTEIEQHTSVLRAVEALGKVDAKRSMLPLEEKLPKYTDSVLTESELVDPEQPVNIDNIFYHAMPDDSPPHAARRIITWVTSLVLLLGLAFAWHYTPLGNWLEIDAVTTTLHAMGQSPLAPIVLILAFVIAALLMIPVTLLIIASVVVFGPYLGSGYALAGAVASAMAGYALGAVLGGDTIKGLAGGKIKRISQKLARRGIFTMVVVRIVPIAPFTIINLVAGASHIRLRDFFWGSLFGLVPGITAIALLTDRVQATLEDPNMETVLILVLISAVIITIGYLLSRYLIKLGRANS
ncbi:MAG: VTT domain-containing protein [Thioalkalispiraceae bacterium]|jgi:phosphatidylserine/phosphatidylglycerophosphate/cardiolipin synthase-like enzyme